MNDGYNDQNDDKSSDFREKFRQQINFQQTEEGLRRVKSEIVNLEIQIRKSQQDFIRSKMALEEAQARLKVLKNQEFELNQNAARQKRAFIAKK